MLAQPTVLNEQAPVALAGPRAGRGASGYVPWSQWTELSEGAGYTASGKTVGKLPPGFYDLTTVNGTIIWLPVKARTDMLLPFPDSAVGEVLNEIETFWSRQEAFLSHDLPFKRGILLWGPAGSGKSSTLQLLARDVVSKGGVVIMFGKADLFIAALRQLRDIQPDVPVVVMMEDIDAIIERQNESTILNLLDGVESVHKCVFVADCFTPGTRFLTADLRWVPCGDLRVGDELWALDEDGPRRRYRRSVVLESRPAFKACVRVTLDTGESFVCSTDHPWLSATYQKSPRFGWTEATSLLVAPTICRPFTPWETETSWEAGWLAGMLDGEGSIGTSNHAEGRLSVVTVAQNVGLTADRLADAVARRVDAHVYLRKGRHDKQQIIDVRGGLAAGASLIGSVLAERLIERFNIEGGLVHNKFPARVVSVEPVGIHEVQSIQTSTGTYIAEGFACHNKGH